MVAAQNVKIHVNFSAGVIEILKKKGEYFAAIKFICEFRLSQLSPGALLLEYMNSAEKDGSENSTEAQVR